MRSGDIWIYSSRGLRKVCLQIEQMRERKRGIKDEGMGFFVCFICFFSFWPQNPEDRVAIQMGKTVGENAVRKSEFICYV